MSSKSRQQLEAWLREIKLPANAKVLDIGGSQNPIKGRVCDFDENTEYKILDLKQPHETKVKPDYEADLNEENYGLGPNNYDVVFCIEVMEYVWNPVTFLDNIQAFMKTGGILYISFHQFYMHHNPESEDCLRYTLSGIKKLMDSNGLEIIDIKRKTMSNDNLLKLQDIFRSEGMRGLYQSGETFMQGYCITAKKI